MLYNSLQFIFLFLPIALIGFAAAAGASTTIVQLGWLVAASCFFYAYWDPPFLALLLTSLAVNFALGLRLMSVPSRGVLALGIAFNVSVLAYFKYRGFIAENLSTLAHWRIDVPTSFVLPLGVSFITFVKIAYLIDVYRGRVADRSFLRFATFVTFFPQLIAGPIVHYGPLMRQFSPERPRHLAGLDLAAGLMFFVIGLAKKVVIADNLAPYADRLFGAADAGVPLGFFEAWLAVFTYSFQIYFDFSGYSDMAVGLARMFGIRLPINFNSPYKATSFIDFWRRWHITLSRFLRDYVYIPLGGNHHGLALQVCALLVTMLLGGLWHGANWTFVIWGGAHGLLLAVNHLWQRAGLSTLAERAFGRYLYGALSLVVTFTAVSALWVLFRSQTLAGAKLIFLGLLGQNGIEAWTPSPPFLAGFPVTGLAVPLIAMPWRPVAPVIAVSICAGLLLLVWAFPNSQQLMTYRTRIPPTSLWRCARWRPNVIWFVIAALLFYWSLACMITTNVRPFTYFAF